MSNNRNVIENDIKYLNERGDYLLSRTQLSLSNLLNFLGNKYEVNSQIKLPGGEVITVDFKTNDGKYIEVIDSNDDLIKFNRIKSTYPELKIVAIGSSKYKGKLTEFESIFFLIPNTKKSDLFLLKILHFHLITLIYCLW